jgi:flagellar biosynthetic protein FlhB
VANSERTEQPTPRRLRRARQQGHVAVSRDLSAAFGFAAVVAVFAATASTGVARMRALFQQALAAAPVHDTAYFSVAGRGAAQVLFSVLVVPLGAALVVGIVIGLLQTGGMFSWGAVRPDVSRLSPAAGFKRLFASRVLFQVGWGFLKASVVLAVAAACLAAAAWQLPRLAGATAAGILSALAVLSARLGVRVALALVVLGILDWLLVRRRHGLSLMMTREEVRRENKAAEGDPIHRAERQRLRREISTRQSIDDVRTADLIVMNWERLAVALKYDRDADGAPVVIAKGLGLVAARIKEIARAAEIPVYRDAQLARGLSDLVEGQEIPASLYEPVAVLIRDLQDAAEGRGTPSRGAATSTRAFIRTP